MRVGRVLVRGFSSQICVGITSDTYTSEGGSDEPQGRVLFSATHRGTSRMRPYAQGDRELRGEPRAMISTSLGARDSWSTDSDTAVPRHVPDADEEPL